MFIATNVPKLSKDALASPKAHFSDGLMDIVITRRSQCGSFQLLKIFLEQEKGLHLRLPYVEFYKCKAFKIEPDVTQEGHFAIDGQMIPYQPVEVSVDQTRTNILCGQ